MEKRAVLAIVLSLLVVVGWSMFFSPSQPPPDKVLSPDQVTQRTGEPAAPKPSVPTPSVTLPVADAVAPDEPAAEIVVHTGVTQLTLTGKGAGVKSVELLDYHTTLDDGAPPVIIRPAPGATTVPLETRLNVGGKAVSLGQMVFSVSGSDIQLSEGQPEAEIVFRGTLADGTIVQRRYVFHYNSYVFDVSTSVEGVQPAPGDTLSLVWGPGLLQNPVDNVQRQGQTEPLPRSYVNGKVYDDSPDDINASEVATGPVKWAALGDTYFAAVLIPLTPVAEAVTVRRVQEKALEVGVQTPLANRDPQVVRVYVGPKSHELLQEVDPSFDKLIDLGFFSPLARPMLRLLIMVNGWVHNYGVTIILVTILIKIVLWPLTNTSHKSMRAMQKLQPKMKDLQARYKDDKQNLNKAMMELYREEKVNPMGGCLPMVLQIPVFFAFYNALLYSIELRHAPFVCWDTSIFWIGRGICDLSVHDPSYITPLLMGATMFLQQRMTPTAATIDPMQQKMMQFMPLMFLFFFLKAPAGLVLYWLLNNVLTIGQQFLINRMSDQAEAKAQIANP